MTSPQSQSIAAFIADGHAKLQAGNPGEAENFYRRALALDPGQPEALAFLGMIAGQGGRLRDAIALFERALKRAPRNADIHHNLGETWRHLGENAKALKCFERATACNHNHIEAYRSGADAALAEATRRESANRWHEAAALRRMAAGLLIQAGQRLLNNGDQSAAAEVLRQATEIAPNSAEAWGRYGLSLVKPYPSKAIAALQRSIDIDPGAAWVHGSLSNALAYLGRDHEAQVAWRTAGVIDPHYYDKRPSLGAYEFLSHYNGSDKADLLALHRAWGNAPSRRPSRMPGHFKNGRDPTRCLRVGYVSGDYRTHSVAYFLEPLLAAHDRENFTVVCYSAVLPAREDHVTNRFKALATLWRNISEIDDAAFCRQVRIDKIDVLVDLSGHSDGSRLTAFAAKPAPVTATWLGYPATTGLANMDWRITDSIADPPGEEAFHTEKLLRLEGGFLCYRPAEIAPEVAPLPALVNDYVTFGSFNNQLKMNPSVITIWSRILKAVPGTRLIIKSELLEDEGVAARLRNGFADEGVDAARIELRPRIAGAQEHLASYADIDIALDPFPYNGTTTTCEALWMGVPVVTLIGDRHSGRVGFDLLTRVGLERFAAPDIDGYVRIATALAADRNALVALRAELRERVARSPLCDATRFARVFESALRAAWRQWCESAA